MGGLRYAELRKQQARDLYKDQRKSDYLATGNFGLLIRKKKSDSPMSAAEKKDRRLRKNQDSAAAARHAQKVYVSVLQGLVQNLGEELRTVRAQNEMVVKQYEELQQGGITSLMEVPTLDKLALNKWLDLTTGMPPPALDESHFAGGVMGVQAAPAV